MHEDLGDCTMKEEDTLTPCCKYVEDGFLVERNREEQGVESKCAIVQLWLSKNLQHLMKRDLTQARKPRSRCRVVQLDVMVNDGLHANWEQRVWFELSDVIVGLVHHQFDERI